MNVAFLLATFARRGMLNPGRPDRIVRQLVALRRWGFNPYGELRSAAARDPDRLVVVDEHRAVTYGELDERVRRLATALRSAYGVRPGDKVGLLCDNSATMVEALCAVVVLGANAVLVNTGLGAAQVEAVFHDQGVRLLIYDDDLLPLAAAAPATVQRIATGGRSATTIGSLIDGAAPASQLKPPEQPGRVIVLTSGTTGTPKGARRRNPAGLGPLATVISRIPLRAGERMFIAAPLFHTWGLSALQLSLGLRGTVVLRRKFDARSTLDAVARYECTSLFAVPVMLQRLLDAPGVVPSLRVAATSGSALPIPVAQRFQDRFGDVIYNLYGSTEASWASIATPAELRAAPGCAGRPPRGTRVAILGDDGRPVPQGVIGRIFVGNDMLFEGYTGGEKREFHDGMIATGDLGHVDSNGLLFVDGREDDMVISGGENVYPSSVEQLLAELPQVREVAVAGVPDPEYGQRLAAWIALRDGEKLDPDAVREYVRHRLARFFVPRDVYFVDALPRNATGKVLLRQLQGG